MTAKKAKPVQRLEVKTIKLPPIIEKKVIEPKLIREKIEILTKIPIPDGHIRCIALIDFPGVNDFHYKGDIFDIPDRRYKTLSNRGIVEKYLGTNQPNKRR